MLPEISIDDFEKFINATDVAVILFTSQWCSACRRMLPAIECLETRFSSVGFGLLDIERSPAIPERFGVMGIPVVIVFVKGREHSRFAGNIKHLEKKLEEIA